MRYKVKITLVNVDKEYTYRIEAPSKIEAEALAWEQFDAGEEPEEYEEKAAQDSQTEVEEVG